MLTHTPWRRMTAPRNIYGSAKELARPVARGDLSLTEADAALIVATLREERAGELEGCMAADVVRLKQFLLRQYLHREEVARDLTAHRIRRRLKPLIVLHKPPNVLYAEAHDVNGADGFPLDEPEVTDIAKMEMYWSLPSGRQSHVR